MTVLSTWLVGLELCGGGAEDRGSQVRVVPCQEPLGFGCCTNTSSQLTLYAREHGLGGSRLFCWHRRHGIGSSPNRQKVPDVWNRVCTENVAPGPLSGRACALDIVSNTFTEIFNRRMESGRQLIRAPRRWSCGFPLLNFQVEGLLSHQPPSPHLSHGVQIALFSPSPVS